jgi:3-deoxy-D-manno-octulosonic-acid transferase
MTVALDLLYFGALLLGWPFLVYRRIRRGKPHSTLSELLGGAPSRRVAGRCVWVHGVSIGEINATRTLVAELHRRSPDAAVVISSTTRTGLRRARELYPAGTVFRFPLDFSFAIRRALDRIRPSIIVLMELELWPNLVLVARSRGIPVVIANGRVTEERSMRRFRWPVVRGFARRMFSGVSWVGAQDAAYAARFRELGVPAEGIEVTGSVKYDTAEAVDRVDGQQALADEMGISTGAPLIVAGSTGPGEEALLLDAYASILPHFPELQLAIVPRDDKRFDEVAALIVQRGYACLRRSTGAPLVPAAASAARADTPAAAIDVARPVFLGDTMGELRKFYALATVVFVGRTFTEQGGSDVMEVAALARPMVMGPSVHNFAEAVTLLLAAGACRQLDAPQRLAAALSDLLRHPERRVQMGRAAREAILSKRGATARSVTRILELAA